MKIALILFSIVLLVALTVRTLKKINLIRLLTVVMLMIYGVGIIKMIFFFPVPSLLLLGAGMLAVLCMALLFKQRSAQPATKGVDHKIGLLHDRRPAPRIKAKELESLNRLAIRNI